MGAPCPQPCPQDQTNGHDKGRFQIHVSMAVIFQYRQKTDGLTRDTFDDERPAFVVRDGNYVSARWPGDTHTFATALSQKLT